MDIWDLDMCGFLYDNLGRVKFIDIENHIASCEKCHEEVKETFQTYKATGSAPTLYLSNIELPAGIQSETEFLKSWHFQSCSNNETNESVELSLRRKLRKGGIELLIRQLLQRQMKMAFFVSRGPRVAIENEAKLIMNSYNSLYDQLGHREFCLFFIGEYGVEENPLKELGLFWGGKHSSKE